ncbi:DUF1614 domain-containing protein [Archaeoglobus sp.]
MLFEVPLNAFIVTFTVCTAVIYSLARPVPNVDIAVPIFILPLVSSFMSYIIFNGEKSNLKIKTRGYPPIYV